MKKLIALAMAAAMAASLAGCASSDVSGASTGSSSASSATSEAASSSAEGETIKIGVLTDRSSTAAATVSWAEAGAILALEEANENGG